MLSGISAKPKARAWVAISKSFGPMDLPVRSSRLRMSA
jgi:hypothetical protein